MLVSDERAQQTGIPSLVVLVICSIVTALVAKSAVGNMGLGPAALVRFVAGAVIVLVFITAVARGGQSDE